MDLSSFRKDWNTDQKRLRTLLGEGSDLEAAKKLFFKQHQVLHSAAITRSATWSYADEIFFDVHEMDFRVIPKGVEHSLLWIYWHISRIEDITMKVLVEDGIQEYISGGWEHKVASPFQHTGNTASPEEMLVLSEQANLGSLLEYRNAVGINTRKLVGKLNWEGLAGKVLPDRLERLVEEGAVLREAEELLAYWSKRRVFELLLMPPTRHLMVHLNQAWSIKKKILIEKKGL